MNVSVLAVTVKIRVGSGLHGPYSTTAEGC
jgi:hypothetical protein